MDLAYNVLQLGVDLVAIALARRSPRVPVALLAIAVAAAGSTVLSAVLHGGPFHLLRLQAWAVFLHGPLLLCGVGWTLRRDARHWTAVFWLGAAALLLVAVDAFLVEPRWLELSRVEVTSDKVERPLRVAVLSDLQTDRVGEHERRAVRLVLDERPDLILMPGDYIDEDDPERYREQRERLRWMLQELGFSAPLGVFASRGNVDPDAWPLVFAGLPVTPIERNRSIPLDGLTVTGLGLWESFDPTVRIPATDGFHIAFGHAPDFALGPVEADLLVAGHTHGGQVRLPLFGPPITFTRVPRDWASGTTRLPDGRTLVVSRGVGMERGRAPRMRFLCRPQVVIIDVVPAGPPGQP
jgi:predicted MPP superfamily phosphohydrolase